MRYVLILYLFHLGEYGPWELYYDDYKSCHKVEHRIEAMREHSPPRIEKARILEIYRNGKGGSGIPFIPCSIV